MMSRSWFIAAMGMLAFVAPSAAFETVATVSGIASARDGDDIAFGDFTVRMQGIAAPEDGHHGVDPGGPESGDHLRSLVEGRLVTCHLDGKLAGRGGRPSGICYLGAQDLGEMQVRAGHARDCAAFSRGRYAAAEQAAIDDGLKLEDIYELPRYCLE